MTENSAQILREPLKLPCGVVLKNRIAKSPMSDSLGDGEGNPTDMQTRLYERWAEGGVALSLIGEVQFDPRYPEKPGNLVLVEHSNQDALKTLTQRAKINNTQIWPQIGHAGALSHQPISSAKGPSALDISGLQCGALSIDDIEALPASYAKAAVQAKDLGFSGVQIHAGHGFLLSQFLSPLFNHRDDLYGGSIENRCRIIVDIIQSVREKVGDNFPIGIRINSSDLLEGGLTENDALEAIRLLDKTSIDLIDISGGTYFPGAKASSEGISAGAYFVEFARCAKKITSIPLAVTGGFKKREYAIDAIESGAVDIVSIGRAMALDPNLANNWFTSEGGDPTFPRFESTIPGGITAWFTMRLTALAEDKEDSFQMDLETAVNAYEKRDEQRCVSWLKTFPQN